MGESGLGPPGVGAPGLSGPFPAKWLPTMALSFMLTGGAAGGAAWLCMATPVAPLSMISLLITTFPVAVVPGKGAIAVFAPPLDEAGNSVKAQEVIDYVSQKLNYNLYSPLSVGWK